MAQSVSKTTIDHDTIRKWAEERGAWPAQVASTEQGGQAGAIRIDFPGSTGEGKLERISWDDWFRKFEESELAFLYEETTAAGQRSSFNKLVGRETVEARRERGEAQPGAGAAPVTREASVGAARKKRPRAASAKRGAGVVRGAGRRQTSRASLARTAGRTGAGGTARRGRKPSAAKGRTRKATSRSGRRGGGRSSRRSH